MPPSEESSLPHPSQADGIVASSCSNRLLTHDRREGMQSSRQPCQRTREYRKCRMNASFRIQIFVLSISSYSCTPIDILNWISFDCTSWRDEIRFEDLTFGYHWYRDWCDLHPSLPVHSLPIEWNTRAFHLQLIGGSRLEWNSNCERRRMKHLQSRWEWFCL